MCKNQLFFPQAAGDRPAIGGEKPHPGPDQHGWVRRLRAEPAAQDAAHHQATGPETPQSIPLPLLHVPARSQGLHAQRGRQLLPPREKRLGCLFENL